MIRKADCPLYRKLRKFWSSDEQSLKQSNESGRSQRPVMSMKRSEFRARLNRYVNGAIFSTSDQVRSLLSDTWSFRAHAAQICEDYRVLEPALPTLPAEEVVIPPYKYRDVRIEDLRGTLEKEFRRDIDGIVLHGSFGSGEPVAYSDFDGLILLNDEVFQDAPRLADLAARLHRLRSPMLQIDPLQHHGWFVLTSSDLRQYPESFLPVEVLKNACSIYGYKDMRLSISRLEHDPLDQGFRRMADTLSGKIRTGRVPANFYQAKVFMSEVMLLPALYVQARDQKGIFKRESFAAARADFSPSVWSIMDEYSAYRANWNFQPRGFDKWMLSKSSWLWLHWRKSRGTPLSREVKALFEQEKLQALETLITEMRRRIGK